MILRLLVVALLGGAVTGLTLAYRRRRAADEARGAVDTATGAALWPDLPDDVRGARPATWLILSTPVCASCAAVQAALEEAFPHHAVHKVDVTERPDLAERYDLKRAPTTVVADGSGRVVERLVGAEAVTRFIGTADHARLLV